MDKLAQDMDFIIEIDSLKTILRQTNIMTEKRRENDAEHSWHLAMMAMVLEEYVDFPVDTNKVIRMLLIHDLVEIYAGDTFCYDTEANKDKKEREIEAADKLFGSLGEKGEVFMDLWEEFESQETKEALFAASLDRLQPLICNKCSQGGTWKKYDIKKEEVYKRIAPIEETSKALWDYANSIVDEAIEKGYIGD